MKHLHKFKCIVSVQDGKLCRLKMNEDGSPDTWGGAFSWEPVIGPQSREFVEAVNVALGTIFGEMPSVQLPIKIP